MPVRRPDRNLPDPASAGPELKEFTIQVGEADLYVNLERHLDLDKEHILYEAVLTDSDGSRMIYVDREDLAACLAGSAILNPSLHLAHSDAAAEPA